MTTDTDAAKEAPDLIWLSKGIRMQGGSWALGELGSVQSRDHPEYSTAARGTSVCPTFTIARVNAKHPSPESRHDSTAARGTSVCRTFTIAHVNAALLRKELDVDRFV